MAALTALVGALLLTAGVAPAVTGPVAPEAWAEQAEASTSADPRADPPRFSWPLEGRPSVVRTFDRPPGPYGPGHRGVDLAATTGQDVLASSEGIVVFAGRVAGRGVVSIDHDGGVRTTYEPVVWKVSAGERVYGGQAIGTVAAGHPGCPVEACLHWGVRRGSDYLDPLRIVVPNAALRLKPWVVTHVPP
ncbi:murein hydrolase activator EnvC family protein [Saccharomonospora cyanea]|uniref:Metalloendopeptidase-like membrane protein n=1 Tax=Saccharomonospora cyanea NA-134 TaxID=882082 RepID=H5XPL2_9PSEU|nr:M23 family metallopeptidase [Saccharomonospora cyanea]EHR60059.1 metalloendopeptidase-like membrane protein [Saccharomonospora cyanea NA-134]